MQMINALVNAQQDKCTIAIFHLGSELPSLPEPLYASYRYIVKSVI